MSTLTPDSADLPDLGGSPFLHGIGHMLIIGATRVGKTRQVELLVTQNTRDGDCVTVTENTK